MNDISPTVLQEACCSTRRRLLSSSLVLVSVLLAQVAGANDVALPGTKPSAPQRLKIWGFEIYDARLWTSAGFSMSQYSEQVFALELTYLRSFEGKDIAKRSIDEMKRIGAFSADQEMAWRKAMSDMFPNVEKGDQLLGIHKPNAGAEFWSQHKRLGFIADPQFARLFFGIWLHEATAAPAIRQAWMAQP